MLKNENILKEYLRKEVSSEFTIDVIQEHKTLPSTHIFHVAFPNFTEQNYVVCHIIPIVTIQKA